MYSNPKGIGIRIIGRVSYVKGKGATPYLMGNVAKKQCYKVHRGNHVLSPSYLNRKYSFVYPFAIGDAPKVYRGNLSLAFLCLWHEP